MYKMCKIILYDKSYLGALVSNYNCNLQCIENVFGSESSLVSKPSGKTPSKGGDELVRNPGPR